MRSRLLPRLRHALVCLLSLLTGASLAQTTLNVGPGQTYTTVHAALAAAHSGDTILVAPGTYYENLTIYSLTVTLRSTQGAAKTILDGGGKDQVLKVYSTGTGSLLTVDGFTIQNGAEPGTTPALGGVNVQGNIVLQNNIITSNYGYPVYIYHGYASVLNNRISAVSPTCSQYNQPALVLETDANLPTSHITGNVIQGDGTACSGNGISVFAISPVVIENNTVSGAALGIYADDGGPLNTTNTLLIRQNLVYNNLIGGINVEALYSTTLVGQGPVSSVIVNNTLSNNLISGSPVYGYSEPTAELTLAGYYAHIGVYNNIINASTTLSSPVSCYGAGPANVTPPWFDSNDVLNQQPTATTALYANCGYSGPAFTGIDGNQSVNPLFVSSTDLHLQSNSRIRDSGNSSAFGIPALDFDGNPRIADTRTTYPVIDPGAYELPGIQSQPIANLTLVASDYNQQSAAPLTLTASLTSPSGPVAGSSIGFLQDDFPLNSAVSNAAGVATITFQPTATGVHRYTAFVYQTATLSYARSTVLYALVQGPPQPATGTTLTCSPATLYVGSTALLFATVSSSAGTPTGSVSFADNGAALAQATLVSGNASYNYLAATAATHALTATYVPTGNFAASSATCSVQVSLKPSTTAIISSLNPSNAGQSVTFTANVTYGGPPQNFASAGSVTFTDGTNTLGSATLTATGTVTSTATYTTASLAVGTHTITATLTPVSGYAASSASVQQVVAGLASTATLTTSTQSLAPGSPLLLTATIAAASPPGAGVPSGTVGFFIDGTQVSVPVVVLAGVASYSLQGLNAGSHTISCRYLGDSVYSPSVCAPITVTVSASPTTLILTSQANPAQALTSVTFAARLAVGSAPAPAGTAIVLTLPGAAPLTLLTDAGGSVSSTVSTLSPGTYAVTAAFAGNSALQASSASLTQVVVANSSATTLTVSPNPGFERQTITLTAIVATPNGAPLTGSITFHDGNQTLATQPLAAGRATFPTTFLYGTHILTATYSGDTNTLASASAPISEAIYQSDFTFSTNPTSLTLITGHHTTFALTAASLGMFADQLQISVDPLPNHATLRLDQTSMSLGQGTQASTSVYLDTDDVIGYLSQLQPAPPTRSPVLLAIAFCLPFGLLGLGRRRRILPLTLLLLAAGLLVSATGCSGKYPASTAAGTYTLRLTATSQQTHIAHTAELTLRVTQ